MKKYASFILSVLFLVLPVFANAQTTTISDSQRQALISSLWQQVYQLQQEIQFIVAQQQLLSSLQSLHEQLTTPVPVPQMSPEQKQQAQQEQYQINCLNVEQANAKALGFDASQSMEKASIDCPLN